MRSAHVALAVYLTVCLAALIWPLHLHLGARIEPYVLGLPFSLAWNAGWVLLTFVVLVVFDHAQGRRP
jgi:hypothetical protein